MKVAFPVSAAPCLLPYLPAGVPVQTAAIGFGDGTTHDAVILDRKLSTTPDCVEWWGVNAGGDWLFYHGPASPSITAESVAFRAVEAAYNERKNLWGADPLLWNFGGFVWTILGDGRVWKSNRPLGKLTSQDFLRLRDARTTALLSELANPYKR